MANDANDEEIIEKRASHPIATAALIIAAVSMIGALVFQVAEISSVRAGMTTTDRQKQEPWNELYKQNKNALKTGIDKVIAENDHPEIKIVEMAAPGAPEGEKAAAKPAGDEGKEAQPAEEAKAEGSKVEETKAEEPKAEEPKAEEPKPEEPAAEGKTEEPKADEPKDEGSKDEAKAEGKTEEPKEEPAAEEPKEEPKKE